MSKRPHDDPFKDCELEPNTILGTRTFEDVLYTEQTEMPVIILTGEIPEHSRATVDGARAFVAGIDTDTP